MKKSELKKRLVEALTPDEAAKVEPKYKETYAAMIKGKGPLKLKKYDNPDKVVRGRVVNTIKNESLKIAEKLGKKAKVGDYIEDFTDSNAPQFKGKSDKKKKQMAVAAFLNKEEQKLDEIDAIMQEDAKDKSEENYSNYFKKMDKNRLNELVKAALMGPISEKKFPDLNDDGKITKADVLIGRGVKLEEEKEDKKDFPAVKTIVADLMDKLSQFKTIDTPAEFINLMESLIDIIIKQSPEFIESGRFMAAMLQLYNKRKDFKQKAKGKGPTAEQKELTERIFNELRGNVNEVGPNYFDGNASPVRKLFTQWYKNKSGKIVGVNSPLDMEDDIDLAIQWANSEAKTDVYKNMWNKNKDLARQFLYAVYLDNQKRL